jgi:hypothetical protein
MRKLIALALLALALAGGVAFVGKHMQRLRERRDLLSCYLTRTISQRQPTFIAHSCAVI